MNAKIIFDLDFHVGHVDNKRFKSTFEETWRCFKTQHIYVCFRKILIVYRSDLKQAQNCCEKSDHRHSHVSLDSLTMPSAKTCRRHTGPKDI